MLEKCDSYFVCKIDVEKEVIKVTLFKVTFGYLPFKFGCAKLDFIRPRRASAISVARALSFARHQVATMLCARVGYL